MTSESSSGAHLRVWLIALWIGILFLLPFSVALFQIGTVLLAIVSVVFFIFMLHREVRPLPSGIGLLFAPILVFGGAAIVYTNFWFQSIVGNGVFLTTGIVFLVFLFIAERFLAVPLPREHVRWYVWALLGVTGTGFVVLGAGAISIMDITASSARSLAAISALSVLGALMLTIQFRFWGRDVALAALGGAVLVVPSLLSVLGFPVIGGGVGIAALLSGYALWWTETSRRPMRFLVVSIIGLGVGLFVALVPPLSAPAFFADIPSAAHSLEVYSSAIADDPWYGVWGTGPNTFEVIWERYRPLPANMTPLWNASIPTSGIAIIDLFVGFGLVGGFVFLAGVLFLLTRVVRIEYMRWVAMIALSIALITPPYISVFIPVVVVVWIVAAERHRATSVVSRRIHPLIFGPLAGVIGIILALSLLPGTLARAGVQIPTPIAYLHDDALRLQVNELRETLQRETAAGTVSDDVLARYIEQGIRAGETAVMLNGSDVKNWLALATFYSQLAVLGVRQSDVRAQGNYANALRRSPNNPVIFFLQGEFDLAVGNVEGARGSFSEALKLRPAYTKARTRIHEIQEGGNVGR